MEYGNRAKWLSDAEDRCGCGGKACLRGITVVAPVRGVADESKTAVFRLLNSGPKNCGGGHTWQGRRLLLRVDDCRQPVLIARLRRRQIRDRSRAIRNNGVMTAIDRLAGGCTISATTRSRAYPAAERGEQHCQHGHDGDARSSSATIAVHGVFPYQHLRYATALPSSIRATRKGAT